MFDLDNLLEQYLKDIEPDNKHLFEYIKAYQFVVDEFGYEPIIQPGQLQILGWDLEYRCGAAFASFIDSILVRRLNDFIPANDNPLILDCGANIGLSSLSYKRQFPNARIIAFEPDPEFAPILRRNLERNGAGDVEMVDAAVWIENGTSQWRCEGIDGSHLSAETGETAKTTTVRTVDLGDYLNEPIDLIKMDIEGAEYEVINHVGKRLKKVKAMSIECHLDQRTMVSFGKMLRVLSAAGFQISIETFSSWRDLIRQPPVLEDHHENYVLVSAWRGPIPAAATWASWLPGAGITPIRDYANQIRFIIQQASARETELLNTASANEAELLNTASAREAELLNTASAREAELLNTASAREAELLNTASAREAKLLNTASAREAELLDYLRSYASSGAKGLKRVVLKRPYQQEIGLSCTIPLDVLKLIADNDEHPNRSTLLLYEDGQLLQPAHSLHDDIRNLGGGRYSHWDEFLYFSTSDGSNPNTNKRTYCIVYSDSP